MNKCFNCGNETLNPKYCSRTCSASSNNKGVVRNPKIHESYQYCINCSLPIEGSGRKFCCKSCSYDYKKEQTYKNYLNNQEYFSDGLYNLSNIKPHIMVEQNNKCTLCNSLNIHNGKPLVFVLDHIDGNARNNLRTNLRCICPNCDSQLDTYKSKNKNSARHYMRYKKEKAS